MLEGLQAILDKDVVVSTVSDEDLLTRPQEMESRYRYHVETFIPMGDVEDFGHRLIKQVQAAKAPKGSLVAPYGYGKTSTLAFLWHMCEKQGMVAVPPFYCASWFDVLKATYGWVKYRLENSQPDLITDLDEIYGKYTTTTLEEMAKWHAEEHGIASRTALRLLNDLLEKGALVLKLTPANLLLFLDATANLVVRAGFKGLAVLVDEFQQYLSKEANLRRAAQEFREFVLGLDTRATPLGVILVLPTYAESQVQELGQDILARLKKDKFYYRLQDIYTNDFPARLWNRYMKAFELGEIAEEIIDAETLRAIGQILEREDLGEGPRTVIECFQQAITCYQDRGRSYTPINLIDDFLEAHIRFQAQVNKVKTVTRQALASEVVDTPEKKQAVRLLAAFPRGCPVDVQKEYDLYDAINSLSKQAHGDLLTHLTEGYTLLGLQRGEALTRTVDLVITEFWRTYEEDDLHLEAAMRAFAEHLLPVLFQHRRGATATGWGELKFEPSDRGGYATLVEGTFNPHYPRRRLRLQVAYREEQLLPFQRSSDFQFDFLFSLGEHDGSGFLEQIEEHVVRFHLNLRRKFGPSMPDDIRKLQDFVNPEFVTPLLMLGLIDYFNRWEEIRETRIPEAEKSEIEFFTGRLIDHIVQLLFDASIGETYDPPLRRVGRQMLEELFNHICQHLYPNYHTLFTQAQYEAVINDYVNAMQGMTLKQRRGHASIQRAKKVLARRFGLGSVATFDNRARNEYARLMDIKTWKGRGDDEAAEIILQLHPLEEFILENLRSSEKHRKFDGEEVPVLPANRVANLARPLGYRDKEIMLVLELLVARRYIRIESDEQGKYIYLIHVSLDSVQLEEKIEHLGKIVSIIPPELSQTTQLEKFQTSPTEIRQRLDAIPEEDEEELDELNTRLSDLESELRDVLMEQRGELREESSNLVLEADRALTGLRQGNLLERKIQGQVSFVMPLNELRQLLVEDRNRLIRQYGQWKQTLEQIISERNDDVVVDVKRLYESLSEGKQKNEELKKKWETLEDYINHLKNWTSLVKNADLLFDSLNHLPDLQERLTREFVPEIQAHLTKRRTDKRESLLDYEPFQQKLEDIENELEKRRRHGNEQFGQEKEVYEELLRQANVGDWRLRSRYTYGEDEDSYKDLYDEVKSKLNTRLKEIAEDLENARTDWLKARYIHLVNEGEQAELLQQSEKQLKEVERSLDQLQKALTLSIIKQRGEELSDFVEQANDLSETAREVRQSLGSILFADPKLEKEEASILEVLDQILNQRDEIDLTDLFVALRRLNVERDLDLSTLLQILEGLYRKNRLVIRIRQRR